MANDSEGQAPGFASQKAASRWEREPCSERGAERIPCRAFSQSATIHLSKERMNGKNPAPGPRTVLQLSKIFESGPNPPL